MTDHDDTTKNNNDTSSSSRSSSNSEPPPTEQHQREQKQSHHRQRNQNQNESEPQYPWSALRVLVLHDTKSCAAEAHRLLTVLDDRLYEKHGIELVYIDSPLLFMPSTQDQQEQGHNEDGDDGATTFRNGSSVKTRVWWEFGGDDHPFLGLDASLLHIRQIWKSSPFIGVIGIGQGASIATLLPALLEPAMAFGVFVHGKAVLDDQDLQGEESLGPTPDWPCLHVVCDRDTKDDSVCRMGRQFPGQVHLSKERVMGKADFNAVGKVRTSVSIVLCCTNHCTLRPFHWTLCSTMTVHTYALSLTISLLSTFLQFLVQQKNALFKSDGVGDELALNNRLHLVQQEAANLVAQHIAEDPPKALMAVVTPQAVGGWSGRKRREFGAEGGGAPCPPEFLLHRENRSGDKNGPSRHHPNARRDERTTNGEEEEDAESDNKLDEKEEQGGGDNEEMVR